MIPPVHGMQILDQLNITEKAWKILKNSFIILQYSIFSYSSLFLHRTGCNECEHARKVPRKLVRKNKALFLNQQKEPFRTLFVNFNL